MQVRQEMETVRNEWENYPRQPRGLFIAGKRSRQAKRSIAAQHKAEERSNCMNRQRTQANREQRKEEHRDSVVVLAKRERVAVRIEHIGIEQMQRIVKGLMKIPPKGPGDHIMIALVSNLV